jgi:hypothetical protein
MARMEHSVSVDRLVAAESDAGWAVSGSLSAKRTWGPMMQGSRMGTRGEFPDFQPRWIDMQNPDFPGVDKDMFGRYSRALVDTAWDKSQGHVLAGAELVEGGVAITVGPASLAVKSVVYDPRLCLAIVAACLDLGCHDLEHPGHCVFSWEKKACGCASGPASGTEDEPPDEAGEAEVESVGSKPPPLFPLSPLCFGDGYGVAVALARSGQGVSEGDKRLAEAIAVLRSYNDCDYDASWACEPPTRCVVSYHSVPSVRVTEDRVSGGALVREFLDLVAQKYFEAERDVVGKWYDKGQEPEYAGNNPILSTAADYKMYSASVNFDTVLRAAFSIGAAGYVADAKGNPVPVPTEPPPLGSDREQVSVYIVEATMECGGVCGSKG